MCGCDGHDHGKGGDACSCCRTSRAYNPSVTNIKIAVRYGEKIREHLIEIEAFDAAAAMRDLLALAYNKQGDVAKSEPH